MKTIPRDSSAARMAARLLAIGTDRPGLVVPDGRGADASIRSQLFLRQLYQAPGGATHGGRQQAKLLTVCCNHNDGR
jgi:hypothetical protein